jgi:hypothetical protein
MRIDEYLPVFEHVEHHEMMMDSTPEQAYDALKKIDFSQSNLLKILFSLRGLKTGTFQDLFKNFVLLSEDPPKEIVIGIVGSPWKPTGNIIKVSKEQFIDFHTPGYAKAAWNFAFEQKGTQTLVSTETRVVCTDRRSSLKFSIYWFFIRPFSGWSRREMLRLLKKTNPPQPNDFR